MSDPGKEVFGGVVEYTTRKENEAPVIITEAEYEQWKKLYTFDGLRGIRYGQSFCNHHGITDYLLYYSLDHEAADRYIRETYIERS